MMLATQRNVGGYRPSPEEHARELRMAAILERLQDSNNINERRRLWDEYVELHGQRTPAMVAALERAKGLCR